MSSSGCQSSPEENQTANQGYVLPEGKVIPNTVFVGGIDVKGGSPVSWCCRGLRKISLPMDEIEIKEYFTRFGAVKEVKIITDRSGVSKGYGFVSFHDDVDVQKIVDTQICFHGKKLKLGPAIRKQNMCTYIQPRPVVISNPMPHYPNLWNTNVPEPYGQQPPVFSPVAQYVQTLPYSSTTPVMYHQIPLGCQQPGYYQVPPQWPNDDQRSMVYPQAFSWNYHHGIETEMASNSNEMLLPETYIPEQNLSPVSTSPQKKVDRSIQTILSCLIHGDGRRPRFMFPQEDYLKDRRMHQFRRSRPFMKPTFDKAGV
ncbi:deleted in azoospermia-like isoform X2 [Ranitomeya variabilis]|uniref:deleted in azoospermia-like isoform X2 n=1 Tax=Ranitomeya variabilis TaxID=490064 RepID=UPI004055B04E